MPEYTYKLSTGATIPHDVWEGASHDELRVLTYLMTLPEGATVAEIAAACGISLARTKSALALWREAGAATRFSAGEPRVSLEFEERPEVEADDIRATEAADIIRDRGLAELIADVASLLGKPVLNSFETKNVVAIYELYPVSHEYVLTLATYMSESARARGKVFSTARLKNKIAQLTERGIDTTEALETYIQTTDKKSSTHFEIRNIIGIWGRNLAPVEEECFERWSGELGYGSEIIREAYSAVVSATGKFNLAYMDKLISAWSAAGVRTIADVEAYKEKHRMEAEARTAEPKARAPRKTKTAEKPTYSSFDTEDALARALARSYGDDESN